MFGKMVRTWTSRTSLPKVTSPAALCKYGGLTREVVDITYSYWVVESLGLVHKTE